jgi:hypothetical protein
MKLHRSFRGHGRFTYTIRPAKRYMLEGLPEYDRGLHAEFVDGFFDTEVAQEKFDWSDEERDLVERFLMKHADWGHALYADPSEKNIKARESTRIPEKPAEIEGQPGVSETVCIAWETDEGASEMCGKPTVDGEFCAKHLQLATVGAAEGT